MELPTTATVAIGMRKRCTTRSVAARVGVIASACIVWAAGCYTGFQRPEVRLTAVRLGALGLSGGTLHAHLMVTNPNRFAVATTSLEYDLELNDPSGEDTWVTLATGTFADALRVPARDSALLDVPIDFRYDGLGAALRSVLRRGSLDYRMTGTVRVDEPFRRAVPYHRAGSVSIAGER